jgi:CDP-4-dehydro-6-deoxyglucose reductase, E1
MRELKNIKDSTLKSKLTEIISENVTKTFLPGEDYIPVTGKVLDEEDILFGVDSMMDAWLTTGRYAKEFETNLTSFMGVKSSILVNSGSSANLVAFYSLTSPSLGKRSIEPGDEIITVAAGFPTTINPLIQYGCIPVFVDIELPTYNIDTSKIEESISPKTKGIMIAHALGNPFNLKVIMELASKYNLWLIEDNCDALGAEYDGKRTGSFGDLATLSFYPAHHITMGEGGAVLVNNRRLKMPSLSFRDWGRDCYCETGCDNTCGKRFEWQLGDLPYGFDHKYIYTHVGFNLKVTDMQAALGVSQLNKASIFIDIRRQNHKKLFELLKPFEEFFILPQATPNSNPSWFGFMLTIRPNINIERTELIEFLESKKIGTRLFFSGNMTKQPAYINVQKRVFGDLKNTNLVMNNSFWIGIWPGIKEIHLEYYKNVFLEFLKNKLHLI